MRHKGLRPVDEIVRDLGEEGFYLLPVAEFDEQARIRMAKSREVLPDESGRVFSLDAETLYESGTADAFHDIQPILARLGVAVPAEGQGKFEIRLGGRSFVIVPPIDDPRESRWLAPALRFLSAFDWYLEQHGLGERLCYTHIDNDSLVACVTPRMVPLLEELGRAVGRRETLQRAPRWEELVKD